LYNIIIINYRGNRINTAEHVIFLVNKGTMPLICYYLLHLFISRLHYSNNNILKKISLFPWRFKRSHYFHKNVLWNDCIRYSRYIDKVSQTFLCIDRPYHSAERLGYISERTCCADGCLITHARMLWHICVLTEFLQMDYINWFFLFHVVIIC